MSYAHLSRPISAYFRRGPNKNHSWRSDILGAPGVVQRHRRAWEVRPRSAGAVEVDISPTGFLLGYRSFRADDLGKR